MNRLCSINDCYELSNGVKIPCVAFGTYKAADGKSTEIIKTAIDTGYRYFDTASFYGTESYLAQAIKESGIPREKFFITSKVWKENMGYEATKAAFKKSLEELQTDYIDLYLIHWPKFDITTDEWVELDRETWKAMEEIYKSGYVKAIGLSNFHPHHIVSLMKTAKVKPMVDQIEFHPGYIQQAVVDYCQKENILVQAWSPIGRGKVLEDELIVELAKRYRVTPAQICLRYALQKNVIPLPKSSSMERMKQNQDIFDFILSEEDVYRIDAMPQVGWSGEHPDRECVM